LYSQPTRQLAPIPCDTRLFDELGLDPAVRRKIMVGNAERLMNMRFN